MRLPHFRTSALPHFRTSALLSIALLFSQLAHAQADATSGPSVISIAPTTTNASRSTYANSCAARSCSICINENGYYNISVTAYFHTPVWEPAKLFLDGWMVASNNYWGDQQGTGYNILVNNSIRSAPRCFTASLDPGPSAWGDYTFLLVATPTN